MKRILILILTALICLSAFSGCGNDYSEVPVDLEVTFSESLTSFPADVPVLFVGDGEQRIKAWRGTYSWIVESADGISNGVNADSPHPLDLRESVPALALKKKTALTLSFEGRPTKITVKRYDLNAPGYDDYETVEVSEGTIEVKAGNYLYEVIATWSGEKYSGTVYYAFRTEK